MGVLCLLGIVGLVYSIGAIIKLYDPAENAFEWPASQAVFQFKLTQAGDYELACKRPGQWDRYFDVPAATLSVWELSTGAEHSVQSSGWNFMKRTDLGGATTLRIGNFQASAPGQFELRNPDARLFKDGDKLRILPTTGIRGILLIFALIASAFAMLGGLILGLIAGRGQ
ncbi:hypothetical protein GCM10027422_35550 [Hymenobacter arcticus]